MEVQARGTVGLVKEAQEIRLEDLGAPEVGTQDIEQPPSFLAAVPTCKTQKGKLFTSALIWHMEAWGFTPPPPPQKNHTSFSKAP